MQNVQINSSPEIIDQNWNELRKMSFVDCSLFIPFNRKGYDKPLHLKPLTDVLNRYIRGESFNCTIHVPPQHFKTETITTTIAQLLLLYPQMRIIYASYEQTFAESRVREVPKILQRYNVKLDKCTNDEIVLNTGGSLVVTTVNGKGSGLPCELFIIDDPFKDRKTVESRVQRNTVWDWFVETVYARVREGKTSILVNHTRWHKDDLIGRIQSQNDIDFEHYRIPALYDGLDALGKPEKHRMEIGTPLKASKEFYEKVRALSEYGFQSKYQGIPVAKGNNLFKDVYYYEKLPENYRIQIGSDFAYSESTKADYTVFVIMLYSEGKYYIKDVIRYQRESPYTKDMINHLYSMYKSKIAAEANGTQKGTFDLIASLVPEYVLKKMLPTNDKFTRAEPVAAEWNSGNILLPHPQYFEAKWLDDFLEEVFDFTGVTDKHDDQIDAMVYAFMNKGIELGDMIMI